MDAGLPPHQYHIHPLPQHYQHYLTSPRMHHFPRNNASTQVVSPAQPLSHSESRAVSSYVGVRLISLPRCSKGASGCVPSQVVHEIRNYPYPQLHLLALQSLNPSRHASAVRESYEVDTCTHTPLSHSVSPLSLPICQISTLPTYLPIWVSHVLQSRLTSLCPSSQELLQLEDRLGSVNRGAVQTTIERFTFPHKYKKVRRTCL